MPSSTETRPASHLSHIRYDGYVDQVASRELRNDTRGVLKKVENGDGSRSPSTAARRPSSSVASGRR